MKKMLSVLIVLSMLLGMTSAFASGDEDWVNSYQQLVQFVGHAEWTIGRLGLDEELHGPFAWPNEATILTSTVEKSKTLQTEYIS